METNQQTRHLNQSSAATSSALADHRQSAYGDASFPSEHTMFLGHPRSDRPKDRMDEIAWDPRFNTGIDRIDFQHQCFVGLINELAKIAVNRPSPAILDGKLTELAKYADYHFCSEELVMLSHQYPGLESHRDMHRSLMVELGVKIRQVSSGFLTVDALIRFLFVWFASHTLDEDSKIKSWVSITQG